MASKFDYVIRRRKGQRRMVLRIDNANRLTVTCPKRTPEQTVEAFVNSQEQWIIEHIAKNNEKKENNGLAAYTDAEVDAMRERARQLLPALCDRYAAILGVKYSRIFYKTQKSVWGSCSVKGNLNFNVSITEAPLPVAEYLVVHELCHLKEMNHSPKFWALVEGVLPDYKERKKWLKNEGRAVETRLSLWRENK